jgi:hypothetical protein
MISESKKTPKLISELYLQMKYFIKHVLTILSKPHNHILETKQKL